MVDEMIDSRSREECTLREALPQARKKLPGGGTRGNAGMPMAKLRSQPSDRIFRGRCKRGMAGSAIVRHSSAAATEIHAQGRSNANSHQAGEELDLLDGLVLCATG